MEEILKGQNPRDFYQDRFMQMITAFHFCYKNFYSYKLLTGESTTQFEMYAPHFVNEYRFAAHFSVVVELVNFLDEPSKRHDTMTLKWLIKSLLDNNVITVNDYERWLGIINNLSIDMLNKMKLVRDKLYAHMDSDFFGSSENDYLMDFDEFEKFLEDLKVVFDEIYTFFYDCEPVFSDFGENDIKKVIEIVKEYPMLKKTKRDFEISKMTFKNK